MSSQSAPICGDFGRFHLESKIGAGGMGEVYRATDLKLRRTVAIKILPARFVDEPSRRMRFEVESQAAAAFNHPNIVTIYDAGVEGETPWIAMEFVEGRTLRKVVADGPLPPAQSIDIAVPLADALAKAHDAGILHRDLKPENIMITAEGVPKILDFGLARILPAASEQTASLTNADGTVTGTLSYMAPEQLLGRSSDHRADQFAFGTILYELLKGQNPFQRETGPQTIAAILETTPRLDTRSGPLSSIVNRCLAKDPAQRYDSTRELARALKAVQQPASAVRWPALWNGVLAKTIIATLAVCILAAGLWKVRNTVLPSRPRVIAIRSFRNLSDDPRYVYYTGGITDEVRSRVSLISSVRLPARSAVDRYSEADTASIRSALNADVILDGEVLAAKGQLRLKLQLRDARTLKTVWSRQYDRASGELPVLRGQVALDVAGAADAPVTADERRRLERRPTTNEEAYDLYLQAKKGRSSGQRDALARTLSLLKQAVELDPRFSDAMADISYLLHLRGDPRDKAEALDWAQKALAVDPDSVPAHQSLANAYAGNGAVTKSRAAFKRAIELDPNNLTALNNFSVVAAQLADFEGSLRLARRSLELNPHFTESYFHTFLPLQFIGSHEQSTRWVRLWRDRFPMAYRVGIAEIILQIMGGDLRNSLAPARKLAEVHKGNIEVESLVADLAMACDAPDAEQLLLKSSGGALDPSYMQYMLWPESPRARLAWFSLRRGDKAAAEKLLADAERVAMEHWRSGIQASGLPIELAAIHALRGDGNEAASWMQRAYDAGWRERRYLQSDPMLALIRENPRMKAVEQQVEDDVRRKREESREVTLLFEQTVPTLPPPPPPRKK